MSPTSAVMLTGWVLSFSVWNCSIALTAAHTSRISPMSTTSGSRRRIAGSTAAHVLDREAHRANVIQRERVTRVGDAGGDFMIVEGDAEDAVPEPGPSGSW
ncbi:hypothetical protein GCM10022255_040530 [Dactylosporangium darangshiense]|uniref:Secreted protein n=1 Tax=Dactylosporangium darangshiense TaxID=579108 RepID=A0ABP8D9P8_9ACTN